MSTKEQWVFAALKTGGTKDFAFYTPAGCFVGEPCIDEFDKDDKTLILSNVKHIQGRTTTNMIGATVTLFVDQIVAVVPVDRELFDGSRELGSD